MKKLILYVGVTCLLMSLCACGKNEETVEDMKIPQSSVDVTTQSGSTGDEDASGDTQEKLNSGDSVIEMTEQKYVTEDDAKVVSESQVEGSTEDMETTVKKLKMTVDGQEVYITLYDTPAATALYDMCPLDLNFEDFNGIEKISYLPSELPTDGEPDGCDPDIGDLCLYAPWGNISVFYEDFRYSDGLIMLGHIDSGVEILAGHENDFAVRLETE